MSQPILSWIDNPEAWNTVYLGQVQLPGIATVGEIPCGPRLDAQKKRKTEGQKLKDFGAEPAKFDITLFINGALWYHWLTILPKIHSAQPSNPRQPLQIIHPLPNSMGVHTVYVRKVKPGPPSAARGMIIKIEVEQWFAEQPETKTKNKAKHLSNVTRAYSQDPLQNLDGIDAIDYYAFNKNPFVGKREPD